MLARSSIKYESLYSKVFQGPPTPLAAGMGFAGSKGLIGFAELPTNPLCDPIFLGDPLPPNCVVLWPGKATILLSPCLNGCIGDTIYLTVNVFPGTAIEENNMVRVLDKIINVLGEETIPQNNIPLFYLYKDGTVEKRVVIE